MNNGIIRLLSCLLSAVISLTAWADNTVSISSASEIPGSQVELSFSLSNTDAVTGVQMELTLPGSLKYVPESVVLNSDRADGHSITATQQDNVLKVVVYSLTKKSLLLSEGTLFTFKVKLGDTPDTYELKPEVILTGTTSPCTVTSGKVTILASRLSVETSQIDFGHIPLSQQYHQTVILKNTGTKSLKVNGVGNTIKDITTDISAFSLLPNATKSVTVTYSPSVRGKIEETLTFLTDADNGDQSVSITADPYAVNELHTGSASGISDTEVSIAVSMNNMDPITGVQCSYRLPEELVYVKGSASLSDRSSQLSISATTKDDVLTIILYSTSKKVISDNDGELFTFRLLLNGSHGEFELKPESVVLGMEALGNVVSDFTSGKVTIDSPQLQAPSSLSLPSSSILTGAQGKLLLQNPSNLPVTISNLMFRDEGFSVSQEFPVTIAAHSDLSLSVSYSSDVAGDFASSVNVYSDDPDQRVITIPVSGTLYEPNTLSLKQSSIDADSYTFSVSSANYSVIKGLQFDVKLDGFTTTGIDITFSDRMKGFLSSVKNIDSSTWRVVIYSFDKNLSATGNEGELFLMKCNKVQALASQSSITLSDAVITGNSSASILTPNSELTCDVITTVKSRFLINMQISEGETYLDKTRVVFNEDASMDYDMNYDASKFLSGTTNVFLYTLGTDNTKYSINERPKGIGSVPVGLYVKKSGEYTLSATRIDTPVYLFDAKKLVLHDLSEGSYIFTCSAGTINNRFQLLVPATDQMGDINNDGKISISDIATLVDLMQGVASSVINASTADLDGDGTISISDLKLLQSKIFNFRKL